LDPHCAAAFVVRGMIAARATHHEAALADLTQAIALDPKFPLAYHERGMLYMLQEKYENAGTDYTRMLELNPGSATGYVMRGLVFQMQGNHEEAVADFAAALQINPKSILAGWNPSVQETFRRRTTELLIDYIEGLWPRLPEGRAAADRSGHRSATPPPLDEASASRAEASEATAPSEAETVVYVALEEEGETPAAARAGPPAPEPPAPTVAAASSPPVPLKPRPTPTKLAPATQRRRPIKGATGTAALKPSRTSLAQPSVDDSAVEILLMEESPPAEATEAAEAAAPTSPAEPPPPASPPAPPPQFLVQCPTCKTVAEPGERLPDRRVRCAQCKSAFLPTPFSPLTDTSRGLPPAPLTAKPSAKKPTAKKTKDYDDDDDDGRPHLTLKQKIVLGVGAAAIVLLLTYYSSTLLSVFGGGGLSGPIGRKVSADDIVRAYVKNPAQAKTSFQGDGDTVSVCGTVANVNESDRSISFKGDEKSRCVIAYFATADEMRGTQPDQNVTIEGECQGIQKSGNVMLTNAKLFPYHEPGEFNLPAPAKDRGPAAKAAGFKK
jgi:hypothetical protein